MPQPRFEEMFRGWLPAMLEDSRRIFDLDPKEMTPASLRDQIAKWGLALQVEVSEMIEEFQWKDWKAINLDCFPARTDSARIASEAADVLHFMAHLLNAAGVTEDDLNTAMFEARKKNGKRQDAGYSY